MTHENWPKTWPKKMAQIQAQNQVYTTLHNVYKIREKWNTKQQLILPKMRVF